MKTYLHINFKYCPKNEPEETDTHEILKASIGIDSVTSWSYFELML